MLIDWFTVVAQAVNFLLLVVVLKYVLYDRIVAAMDARERRIAERVRAADEAEREAGRAASEYHERERELDEAREELLQAARAEAEAHRQDLTERARSDVDDLRQRWTRTLEREQRELIRELEERAGQEVCRISRRVLRDLADADLDARAAEVALERLREDGALEELAAKARAEGTPLAVRTALELDGSRRRWLEDELHRVVAGLPELDIGTDPDLVCGLEVRAAGQASGWSVAGYLDALTTEITEALQERGAS